MIHQHDSQRTAVSSQRPLERLYPSVPVWGWASQACPHLWMDYESSTLAKCSLLGNAARLNAHGQTQASLRGLQRHCPSYHTFLHLKTPYHLQPQCLCTGGFHKDVLFLLHLSILRLLNQFWLSIALPAFWNLNLTMNKNVMGYRTRQTWGQISVHSWV